MGTINKLMLTLTATASLCIPAFAQNKPVHIKVIKVIDGDSTVIEKDVDENELQKIEKELSGIKGKNVKVMMQVEKSDATGMLQPQDRFVLRDSLPGVKMQRNQFIISSDTMVFAIPGGKESFRMEFPGEEVFDFKFGEPGDHFIMRDSFPGFKMIRKELINGKDTMVFLLPDESNSFHMKFPGDDAYEFRFEMPGVGEMEKMMNGYSYAITEDNGVERIVVKTFGPDSTGKTVIRKFEGKPGDEFEENIVINSPSGKTVHKVIVTTRVKIEDTGEANEGKALKKEKNELKLDDLKFYPNPSDGRFNIEFENEGKQPVTITITDMNGKQVRKQEVKGEGRHNLSFDLTNEGKGTYILNLRQGKKSTTKKIVIE